MAVWVAFLRGINVGGRHKVPMAELRSLCEGLGLTDVRTLIASGNLVFTSPMRSAAKVRDLLEGEIEQHFGFPVTVAVRTPAQLRKVVEGIPFDDEEHVSVSFLVTEHERAAVAEMTDDVVNDAQLTVVGDHAYLYTPKGLGQPFLTAGAARRLSQVGTVRNWRTVNKVLALAESG